jgi:O-antigen/teichoic acid export membrane protein
MTNSVIAGRLKRLAAEGSWVVVGQLFAIAGTLAGIKALTGVLGPEQYGRLALAMTVATLANQVLFAPIGNGVARFYSVALEQGDLSGYFSAVRRITWAAAAGILAVGAIFTLGCATAGWPGWTQSGVLAILFALVSGLYAIRLAWFSAARRRTIVALHQGLEPWLRVGLALGFCRYIGPSSDAALLGCVVAGGAMFASQSLVFGERSGEPTRARQGQWMRDVFAYSWPFATWGGFCWAQSASDRWALEAFATTQDVGSYAVLFQFGYAPVGLASGMAVQFLAPIFYQRAGSGKDVARNAGLHRIAFRLAGVALAITVVAAVVAGVFHRELFLMIAAPEFSHVSPLLPWMLAAGGLFATGQTIALHLMSQMKTRLMLTVKIVTAIFGIGFNIVGAIHGGIGGVVAGTLLFSLTYCVWIALLAMRPSMQPPSA